VKHSSSMQHLYLTCHSFLFLYYAIRQHKIPAEIQGTESRNEVTVNYSTTSAVTDAAR